MNEQRIDKRELLGSLPDEWPEDLLPQIQERVAESGVKVVVLDDDPTGTQTVHGVPVLTDWSARIPAAELADTGPIFYVLTNSRSLPLNEAKKINAEIGRNLVAASKEVGRDFVVISRSDSTLRGHYPGETDALAEALGQDFDAWLIIPFFLEGGRYTINDVHYVAEDNWLVPAGQTEFAADAAFGYCSSNLREWVEEKTKGKVLAKDVTSISIEDLRQGGPDRVAELLLKLAGGCVCVVNAACYRDLEVFTMGLLTAEASGKRFGYRTAASIVRVRAGITPRSLLTRADLKVVGSGGGLVLVGSYVPRSTRQVNALVAQSEAYKIEIDVEALLTKDGYSAETRRVSQETDQALRDSKDVLIYTSRQLVAGTDAKSSLSVGQRISAGLVDIIRSIQTRPRYLLAKGGITASDLATEALGVKRAEVLGQILPGVPVWRLGPESRWPGLSYIVFPGNVGNDQALVDIVTTFKQ